MKADSKLEKNSKLRPPHLAVLMRAAMYKSGLFYESQGSIAKHTGMTRQLVAKVQNELASWGYLTMVKRRPSEDRGWTKEYQLNIPFSLLGNVTMRDESLLDSSAAIVRSEQSHCYETEHNLKKDLKKDNGAHHAPSVGARAPVHSDTVAADNLLPDPSPPIDTLSSSSSSPPPTREDDDEDEVVSLEDPERTQTTERALEARRLRKPEPEPESWTEPDSLRIIETLAARLVDSGMELREAQRTASKTYAEDPAAAAMEVDGVVVKPDPKAAYEDHYRRKAPAPSEPDRQGSR